MHSSPLVSPPGCLSRWSRVVLIALAIGASSLTGCATSFREYVHNGFKVGPNYARPAAPVSDQWIDYQNDRVVTGQEPHWAWWRVFNDPKLDALIQTAHNQNITLREAGFRIYEARALRAVAVGNLFPQTQTLFGSYTRQRSSVATGIQAGGARGLGAPRHFSIWNGGAQLTWELDFWGRYRRAIESADATLDASVENYDDILVILIGDLANAYIQVRTIEQRIQYAEANVRSQAGSLRLAEDRLAGGAVGKLDVTQAITNLAQTEASIPELRRLQRVAENQLCVLLGIPPEDLRPLLDPPTGVPLVPPDVVVGIPAELLRRRPDIRRAEREAAAQSALIGVAEADLYPMFSLNGNIALRSNRFGDLFSSDAMGGGFGPSFNWNILNYGRIRNTVAAQEARFMQEILQYQAVVLNAQREVEDAMVGFLRSQEQYRHLQRAADAALESRDLVEELYRGGAADFGRVFVAELTLAQQQDALAVARGNIALNLIETYRALGGGWQIRLEPLPPMEGAIGPLGPGLEDVPAPRPPMDMEIPGANPPQPNP